MPIPLLAPRVLDYAQPMSRDAPLNRGLQAWWLTLPQRRGSMRWPTLTGRTHGTLVAMGPSSATSGWGATQRPGGFGELRFDGTNDYVTANCTLGTVLTASAGTVSLWVRPLGTVASVTLVYRGQGLFADDAGYFGLYRTNLSGTDQLWAFNFAGSVEQVGVPYTVGVWTHLTLVHGNGLLSLYKDGRLVPSPIASGDTGDLSGAVWLGQGYNTEYLQGALDDCRVYNRALNAREVWGLFLASRLRYPTELRWRSPLHVVPFGTWIRDATLPGAVANGITILWAGTVASIPTGWSRATALDGLYPCAAPASTEAGGTGGSATHTHTSTAHAHTTTHTHTVPDTTGSAGSSARDTGTTNPPAVHTHGSNPATVSPATSLATDMPSTDSVSTEPPYFGVLFLRSDGTSLGFPASTVALWNSSAGTPSGWSLADGVAGRPDLRGRYLKGAATGADGGGTGGATTHSHTLASHTHSTPYAHAHPNVTSSQRTEALTTGTISGAAANVATSTHTHSLTIASSSPAITGSTDAVSTVNHEPPYWVQAYIQNISGVLDWPDRIIALWMGTIASIPTNWVLCDGGNGTPDLRTYFIKGASVLSDIGTSGGSASHTHTATGHTHAVAAHTHTVSGAAGASESRTAGATNAPTDTHTHTWPNTGSTSFTSGSATPTVDAFTTTAPPYINVLFVQWQAPAAGRTTKNSRSFMLGMLHGMQRGVGIGRPG